MIERRGITSGNRLWKIPGPVCLESNGEQHHRESKERTKEQECRDCLRQLRSHHAGCGGEEQCRAGSHLQKRND